MALSRPIRIGTDCSGMEAPIQAIRNLKVDFEHKFSCDINKDARMTICANFPHGKMYEDLTKRDNERAPSVDLYVAGFPCQPFSSCGIKQGFGDKKGRGKIFFHVLDFIATKKPRVFVLENVSGLVKLKGGKYMKAILQELESLGKYNVQWKILDTKENGIPHSRRRWYCIGINKAYDEGTFKFPQPIKCPSINLFLERRNSRLAAEGLPPKSQSVARGNVQRVTRELKREGSDPKTEPFVMDCDSTPKRVVCNDGVSPCITSGRGAGHWVTNRGRRLTKTELMRLQGMDPTKFKVAVSENQLGRQLGNTMSVNVLERLFASLLPAAKLVRKSEVKDRWSSGQAVKMLARTRGRGFKYMSEKAKQALKKKEIAAAAASSDEESPRGSKRSAKSVSSPVAARALKRRRSQS